MYRKIVWCYIIVLALLDISLNTKLSAQGKSHGNGVSVHESLMEGISLQEWGGEGRRAVPAEALALSPAALAFGRCALAAAHSRAVTLTNTGNETIHLASVAGTTPDFHASFFESKTLVAGANTTFTVVFVGRREGATSTHLYIHSSRGVLRYPVSAEGVGSAWRVWPLVGARVPLNATLEVPLALYNPGPQPVQVTEVYSSAEWLQLEAPGGGGGGGSARWLLPPRAARTLLTLRLRPPHAQPLHAFVRIKGNMTDGPLLLAVEAHAAPPSEYLRPLQLRLRTHGSRDPPHTWTLEAGNSADSGVLLDAEVWGARCAAAPSHLPHPHHAHHATNTQNGGRADSGAGGARVALTRETLSPHQEPVPAATLTLDYGALWAGAERDAAEAGAAWCAGWARVGRAAAPYSLRLRPGTLRLDPPEMHVVWGVSAEARLPREVRAHNEFAEPVLVEHVHFPPDVQDHFHTESLAPLVLGGGRGAAVARLQLRSGAPPPLRAALTLHTNMTDYTLPLLLYEGTFQLEWEWPIAGASGELQLGAVSALSTRRVTLRLHNRGVAALCVAGLRARLPAAGGSLALRACPAPPPAPGALPCAPPHTHCTAELTVVAPGRAGPLEGEVVVASSAGEQRARVALSVHEGRVTARAVRLRGAAPYVRAQAPLELDASMQLAMQVTHLTQPAHAHDPALRYVLPEEEAARAVRPGAGSVGRLEYRAEELCAPRCATGLALQAGEGAAWLARSSAPPAAALAADRALRDARRAAFTPAAHNISALLHTTEVVGISVSGVVSLAWPALARGAEGARLAAVGGSSALRVAVRNPARTTLALHALVAGAEGGGECPARACRPSAFTLGEWAGAGAAPWAEHPPLLLLQPGAEIDLAVSFAPTLPADFAAVLYLRNNLTILESVPLSGRGAFPRFEVSGRAANSSAAIVVEVGACGAGGALGAARRALTVRNTGAVPLRLRDWRLAGQPCQARGLRLQPCAPLALAPNESRALTLHYSADWTRARVAAVLSARAGQQRAEFTVHAVTPARLLHACAPHSPRPPFEALLRGAGTALALAALLLAAALAACDAERALRRQRAARPALPPRAPLDLRALAAAPPAQPAAPPPPPPRRRRTPRRRAPAVDSAAERLAFARWHAEVGRRPAPAAEGEPRAAPPAPRGDASSSEGDSSPPAPRKQPPAPLYSARRRAPDERASTNSDSSERSERSERSDRSERSEHSERSERSEHSEHSERSEADEAGAEAAHHDAAEEGEAPDAPGDQGHTPPAHAQSRGGTSRRESGAGRGARAAGGTERVRTRSGSARAAVRKERGARRRARAASPAGGAAPRTPAPAALRWGASWSSVVSRGALAEPAPAPAPAPAPLAPIGSDVPRRSDHSLFYYGGAERDPPPAPPAPPAPAWPHARADYTGGEEVGFRSLEAVWGSGAEAPAPAAAAWLWGVPAPAVRPPPGFAPREYDPFHSLASIWTPAALDWRREPPPEPARPAEPAPERRE